ncbi:MAG: trypsin-like peptidase domain-containing protein [Christensenellales bacterium]
MSQYYSGGQPPYGKPPRRRGGMAAAVLIVILLLAVTVAIVWNMLGDGVFSAVSTSTPNPSAFPSAAVTATPMPSGLASPSVSASPTAAPTASPAPTQGAAVMSIPDIAEAFGPSVVAVQTGTNTMVPGQGYTETPLGAGSGVVYSADGYIITNNHVIKDAQSIYITFSNQKSLKAEVVGTDAHTDLAVLKVEANDLLPAPLGDSDAIRVGEVAIAIGNPLGQLAGTVTVGYISAIRPDMNLDGAKLNFLQTDAAINPGNSGGALVNERGQLIGINTLKYVYAGTDENGNPIPSEGMGFALPINDVKPIIEELIANGTILRPALGIRGYNVSEQMGLPEGLLIAEAIEGSAAQAAGLRANDIIIAVDGVPTPNFDVMTDYLATKQIGDSVNLTVIRSNREIQIQVKLAPLPD